MNTVEFPGLGITLDVNPIAFSIFSKPIYWYGIFISLAFIATIYLALKQCDNFGISQDDILDMSLFAGPIGIVGARLYYVIFSWDNYSDDFLEIFKIWNGGLAIYGGIIAGVITAYIFAKVRKIKPLKLFDFAIIYIPLAQGIGRWGNFFNQEAFGNNTSLPWGMTSESVRNYLSTLTLQGINVDPLKPVHPTFFYEFILDICIFFILLSHRKNKKADGEVFLLYLALYGLGRFFIEGLRTDSLMLGSIRISQLLSVLLFILATILIIVIRFRASKLSFSDVEIGKSEYGSILQTVLEEEAHQKDSHIIESEALDSEDGDMVLNKTEAIDDIKKETEGKG